MGYDTAQRSSKQNRTTHWRNGLIAEAHSAPWFSSRCDFSTSGGPLLRDGADPDQEATDPSETSGLRALRFSGGL